MPSPPQPGAGNAFNVSGFVLALSSYASPVVDGF